MGLILGGRGVDVNWTDRPNYGTYALGLLSSRLGWAILPASPFLDILLAICMVRGCWIIMICSFCAPEAPYYGAILACKQVYYSSQAPFVNPQYRCWTS